MYICPLERHRALRNSTWVDKYLGFLDCVVRDDCLARPALLLEPVEQGKAIYRRCFQKPTLFHITSDVGSTVQLGLLHQSDKIVDCLGLGK